MSIRVLLVDDHHLIRLGLRKFLEEESDIEVVAEAVDGREAVERCGRNQVDVVVMDIQMPRLNGADAAAEITRLNPGTAVIALSAYTEKVTPETLGENGFRGVVCKASALDELVRAIRTVSNGDTFYDGERQPVLAPIGGNALQAKADSLTIREREVLQLLAEGHSTKAAAYMLQVSPKTVETHRRNLMQKLDIDNLAGLTKFALSVGLTN